MPHDVIMPALGMAQETGRIVAWLKEAGDKVEVGEPLMEVETDKATMEVEAQASGYLGSVSAGAGDDVPVGAVVARIADTPEDANAGGSSKGGASEGEASPEKPSEAAASAPVSPRLPEGRSVIMPALGMAQDTGKLVAWSKQPGEAVAAGDILFEVETDKSTMEVETDSSGWLAAVLASAGDEVPVGETVAIISKEEPETPVVESYSPGKSAPEPEPASKAEAAGPVETDKPAADQKPAATPGPAPASGGRVLASPKARRLALEEGLDINRLVEAGYPQPYHVKDIETLRTLPAAGAGATAAVSTAGPAGGRLSARLPEEGLKSFCSWIAQEAGSPPDEAAVVAGFAAAGLGGDAVSRRIAVDRRGTRRIYAPGQGLGVMLEQVEGADEEGAVPDLLLRDLRSSRIADVALGAEEQPVVTLTRDGTDLVITLEFAPGQLSQAGAVALMEGLSDRIDEPLRHLL